MGKFTVIYGPPASGKSTLARKIAEGFPSESVHWTHYSDFKTGGNIPEGTRLIVLDEWPLGALNWAVQYFRFKRQGDPYIIILTQGTEFNRNLSDDIEYIGMPGEVRTSLIQTMTDKYQKLIKESKPQPGWNWLFTSIKKEVAVIPAFDDIGEFKISIRIKRINVEEEP